MAGLAFKVIGTIGLASYAIAYLCAKSRHVSYHRFKVVAVPTRCLPAMPRGYCWRTLDRGELARPAIDIGAAAQAERFADGLECLGVFDSGSRLVGIKLDRNRDGARSGVRDPLPASFWRCLGHGPVGAGG